MRMRFTLTHKFIGFLLLTAVLPLCIVGVSSYYVSRAIIRDEAARSTRALVDDQRDYLDLNLQQIASLIANVGSVEEITEVLARPTRADTYTSLATQARIGYLLDGYTNLRGLVSIDIFTTRGDHYHVGDTLDVSRLRADVRDRLVARAEARGGGIVWAGIEPNINASSRQQQVLTAARMVLNTGRGSATSQPVGVLLVNASVAQLHEHFAGVNIGDGAYLVIVDAQGRMIYHPDTALLGATLNGAIRDELRDARGAFTAAIEGQEMIVTYARSSMSDWTVLSFVPVATLDARASTIGLTVLAALAAACLIIGVAAALASRMIVSPLRLLIGRLQLLQAGGPGWEAPLQVRGADEVAELGRWFNTFLETLGARSRAEEALAESEARVRAILDHAPAVIYVKDLAGRFVFINQAFEAFLQQDAAAIIGRTDAELFPADLAAQFRAQDGATFSNGLPTEKTEVIPHPGGPRTYQTVKFALVDRAGTPYALCGISTDITERLRLEAQYLQAQKMESIGHLAGGIAHDFNNLLTVIAGYADMALEAAPPGADTRGDLLEIRGAVDRAAQLTRQLLAFARRQPLQAEVLQVNTLITDMAKMLKRLIGESIELSVQLDPRLGHVRLDPGQIEQVLVNLAVNARDAMPGGGLLTITTRQVCVSAPAPDGLAPGAYVALMVRDTGCGMAPEVRARAFEPFFSTKEQGRGTGLGLASCYGIIKQHGGTIALESAVGVGTTVVIHLPIVAEDAPAAVGGPVERPVRGGTETVLLVEDEPAVRALAARTLRRLGYTVVEAANGQEAVAISAGQPATPFHLLLTDVMMPKLGGVAAAEQIVRQRPGIKVQFMSGHAGTAGEQAMLAPGPLLAKPFTPDILAQHVRQRLEEE